MLNPSTVFVQPYPQDAQGGSSRIFSSLLQRRTEVVQTIVFSANSIRKNQERVHFLPERHFGIGSLERTRLGAYANNLWPLSWSTCRRVLRQKLDEINASNVHAIAHGLGFFPAYQWATENAATYSLTIHDDIRHLFQGHFWLKRIETWLAETWANSANRFVISPEIAHEYCRRYGERPWIQITDGLEADSIANGPCPPTPHRLNLYFAGGLNVPYEPNFLATQQALKQLTSESNAKNKIRFILRGGRRLKGEDRAAPPLEVRPFAPQEEVLRDLDEADLLYLPLSIDPRYANFAKYSLSTKMITYLGSGKPIFYHGPEESAAYRLLSRNNACVACFTNRPEEIAAVLKSMPQHRERIVANALDLARREFRIEEIRERFWSCINDSVDPGVP